MPNYDYANSAGLTALSERTFEKIKSKITTDVVTSEAENPLVIETAAAQTAKSTIVEIEPIQDLHGYDHPWPAGGGKNLLPPIVAGSNNGLTWTVSSDGIVTINGTASSTTTIDGSFGTYLWDGTTNCWLSGCPSGGSSTSYALRVDASEAYYSNYDTGSGVLLGGDSISGTPLKFRIVIRSGIVCNNLVFKPMLEEGTSGTSYEPYSNICPISGLDEVTVERTGFNQWDEEWELGTYDGITGAKVNDSTKIRSKNYIPVIPETNYYFFEDANPAYHNLYFYDADKNFLSVNTRDVTSFTTPSNAYYITFTLHSTYGTTYNHDICINISDASKNGTYEPYALPIESSVDLPTTIYSGTLDLETGEVVADMGMVDLGTLDWIYRSSNGGQMESGLPLALARNGISAICENYTNKISASGWGDIPEGCFHIRQKTLRISTGLSYTDVTSFKTAMSGVQLCYELATPITCTLTPKQLSLLKGVNVITTNGKTIQVTYREGSLVTLEELDAALLNKECISEESNPVTIKTDAAQYAKATHLTLAPVQDLHGYDHPWPAGGGKNLFDESYEGIQSSTTVAYYHIQVGNGTFTLSTTMPLNTDDTCNLFLLSGSVSSGASSLTNGVSNGAPRTVTSEDGYVTIGYRNYKDKDPREYKTQLESGSTATSYFPYSNICPISGTDAVEVRVTGKNLWDRSIENRGSSNCKIGGAIAGGVVVPDGSLVLNEGTYTASASDKQNGFYVVGGDGQNIKVAYNVSSITFTINKKQACSIMTYKDGVNINYWDTIDVQLELGSTATAYEPYTESTFSLDLPESVYSGTLDLETGKVVADRRTKRLTTGGWGTSNNIAFTTLAGQGMTDAYLPSSGANANAFSNVGIGATWAEAQSIDYGVAISYDGYIGISNKIYSALINGDSIDVCYKLAAPKTYQLTPQQLALFKGTNVVSTNTKTVRVTYREGEFATTENIVEATEIAKASVLGDTDAKIATSLAPILGNFATAETSPTSASHAVGEYLLYNNLLYKVLAAISAGQQLTIGTNVEQTNVAAELARTTGSNTAENQYVSVSYNFTKTGNVCFLYVELTPKQTINTSTGAVTLNEIPKPITQPIYSATYDSNSVGTICGCGELTIAKNLFLYGARTTGHVYKASFTYIAE